MASSESIAARRKAVIDNFSTLAKEIGEADAEKRLQKARRRKRDRALTEVKVLEELWGIYSEAIKSDYVRDTTPIEGNVRGLNPFTLEQLKEKGITNKAHLRKVSDAELIALDGVGPNTLQKIRAQL